MVRNKLENRRLYYNLYLRIDTFIVEGIFLCLNIEKLVYPLPKTQREQMNAISFDIQNKA